MHAQLIFAVLAAVTNADTLVNTLKASNSAAELLKLAISDQTVSTALQTFQGTVFAPSDAAFTAFLKANPTFDPTNQTALTQALTYHVVPGTVFVPAGTPTILTTVEGDSVKATGSTTSSIQISSAFSAPIANVVKSDKFDSGIIHYIDAVLTPPSPLINVATAANLSSLVSAIVSAGLESTVVGLRNATIFAPTNAAFDAISSVAATLSKDQLADILKLHIVAGAVYSPQIVAAKSLPAVPTVNGASVDVEFDGTSVTVKGAGNTKPAKVVVADVFAQGQIVVHVIDEVLLPAAATTSPSASGQIYSHSDAVKVVAGLVAGLVTVFAL